MALRNFLLSILVAVLAGAAAIFEKASLRDAAPLTVFTIRSVFISVLLMSACLVAGNVKPLFQVSGRTLGLILIPAVLATTFVGVYFSILKNDLASRVFPILAAAPLVTMVLSVTFLGEPFSWKRLAGAVLIVAGVVLVK
ncbi:MAG TPA: EamA family transporter [bacterium]|nr:EamA family transporter [bacterium]